MKKFILVIVGLLIIFLIIPKEKEELRIRVIAASNQLEDQIIKMEVVRSLQNKINEFSKKDIVKEVKENLDELDKTVRIVLKDKKYEISIARVRFPPKEIKGEIIKGGTYQTLLIVIEEGKGKNWWSLLYPDYHHLSFEDLETGDVTIKVYFWESIKNVLLSK